MKISKETLTILKNFANINSNLSIHPGNKLATITAGRNIIATVVVTDEFPCEFGIYDLSEFLGVMSLFESPDLEFNEKYVIIKEGKNGIKYFSANSDVLTEVPTIKALPAADVEFDITGPMIQQIQRVSSILRVPDFSVVGDGETISISVGDRSNPTSNSFTSDIGTTDKTFSVNFKVENLKMIPGDYHVSICNKKISHFKASNSELVYYVAIELNSSFDF